MKGGLAGGFLGSRRESGGGGGGGGKRSRIGTTTRTCSLDWDRSMVWEKVYCSLRKASNILNPSVKPLFSPKAASSRPWLANPFMGGEKYSIDQQFKLSIELDMLQSIEYRNPMRLNRQQ